LQATEISKLQLIRL